MSGITLQSLAEGFFRASWQASILAVVILGIQRVLTRRLSARARYGLWGLVLLRLAIPFDLPSPVSLHNLYAAEQVAVERPVVVRTMNVELRGEPAPAGISLGPVVPQAKGVSWREWMVRAWVGGCVVAGVMVVVSTVRLGLHLRRQRRVGDERILGLLRACAAEVGVRRLPVVLSGPEAGGPALVGFVRPKLLLPESVLVFEDDALRLILLHELAHQKRGDVLGNWVLAGLQVVHWFNPLVHLIFARVRADRELACDERVLSLSKSAADRPAYGRTIVRLVESLSNVPQVPAPAVGILEGRHQLRRRIAMIAERRPVRRAWSLVAVVGALVAGAVAGTDAVRGENPRQARGESTLQLAAPARDPNVTAESVPGAERRQDPALGVREEPTEFRGTLNLVRGGMLTVNAAGDERLNRRLPELKLDQIPMSDALEFVREQAKVNLFVDKRALEVAGADMNAPVSLNLKDITVQQAFQLIGKAAAPTGVELGAVADGDVILFGVVARNGPDMMPAVAPGGYGAAMGPEGMGGMPTPTLVPLARAADRVTRVYDVEKLCGDSQEKINTLVSVVMGSLNPGKASVMGAVQSFNGKLVVTASPDLQEQVVQLLDMLKSSAPASTGRKAPDVQQPVTTGF